MNRDIYKVLMRRFPKYYEAVRLPAFMLHGRIPVRFTMRTFRSIKAKCMASRFPRNMSLCMQGVSDPAEFLCALPLRSIKYCFPFT
jgi:hypothetical protein